MWIDDYRHRLYLQHHGIKGQKWGVRRTPEQLGHVRKKRVEKSEKESIIKTSIYGHEDAPRTSKPNSVIDHVDDDGKIKSRSYYGDDGYKVLDIHTTDHGHPKQHPYGDHGEHAEEYEWNEDGTLYKLTRRELTKKERKENSDIL